MSLRANRAFADNAAGSDGPAEGAQTDEASRVDEEPGVTRHPFKREQKPIRLSVDLEPDVAFALEDLVMQLKREGHRAASKAGLARVMIDRLLADSQFRDEVLKAAKKQL